MTNEALECNSGIVGCPATAFSPDVARKAGWVMCKSKKSGDRWRCDGCNYAITLNMPSIALHESSRTPEATRAAGVRRG